MQIGRLGRQFGVHRKPERICNFCSSKFNSWQDRKYCSSKCYHKSMVEKKVKQNISNEEKERRRQRMLGENNPMWNGGDSDSERRNSEYIHWRIAVFKRDGFTCQDCGYKNGVGVKRKDLHAHHIVAWIESIELRYEVENGITLCVPCHIKKHLKTKRLK